MSYRISKIDTFTIEDFQGSAIKMGATESMALGITSFARECTNLCTSTGTPEKTGRAKCAL